MRIALGALVLVAVLADIVQGKTERTIYGSADPAANRDAIQSAVDEVDIVRLSGIFPLTGLGSPVPPAGPPTGVVTITRSVIVAGIIENGARPTIEGGYTSFLIEAPGATVELRDVRFVPAPSKSNEEKSSAIASTTAGKLTVARCEFDCSDAVGIALLPVALLPGQEAYWNTVSIIGNEYTNVVTAPGPIEVAGIVLNPRRATGRRIERRLTISGNSVHGATGHGISVIDAGGKVAIEGNVVTTGTIGRSGIPGQFVDAIRCTGGGDYRIRHNTCDCGFANGAGIRIQGTRGAVAEHNFVSMSVPSSVSDETLRASLQSAAIVVQGTCEDSVVRANVIAGRARVGMAVVHSDFPLDRPPGTTGDPAWTTLERNVLAGFAAAYEDVEVSEGSDRAGLPNPPGTSTPVDTLITGGPVTFHDTGVRTVVLAWADPADIVYGTPLSDAQLDATATNGGGDIPGTFAYDPGAGAILGPGRHWTLSVTFTPFDSSYRTATHSVSLAVLDAADEEADDDHECDEEHDRDDDGPDED